MQTGYFFFSILYLFIFFYTENKLYINLGPGFPRYIVWPRASYCTCNKGVRTQQLKSLPRGSLEELFVKFNVRPALSRLPHGKYLSFFAPFCHLLKQDNWVPFFLGGRPLLPLKPLCVCRVYCQCEVLCERLPIL